MSFMDKLRAVFAGGTSSGGGASSKRLDVESRFERLRSAVSGTMSNFQAMREINTGKLVGVKLLDMEKYTNFESRFKGLNKPSEGEIAIRMKHPTVMETYEYGFTNKNQPYLIVEYIDGPGLHQLIQNADEKVLRPHRLSMVRQMAEALKYVHEAGYIHRDVCPRNFICSNDLKMVKLIDFGLTVPATVAFMQPGNRTGTPLYMAPEIVRRKATDQRVDVFSFGVSIFCLYAFRFPWEVLETSGKAALRHDTTPPLEIQELLPKMNPLLAKAIMRCLHREAAQRMPSMAAFLQAISSVSNDFND
jgi:eukaryotic-like serine/threonine-protein kinase